MHRCHTERATGQHEAVHLLGHCMRNDVRGINIRAGGQMRAVLLSAARRQEHKRVLFELSRDFGLREVDEITAR
jgi:hypothetical protein